MAAIPAMPSLGEDGVERLDLVVGGEHRAADEPLEVGASGDQGVELVERLGDGGGLAPILREREQRGGVASGYAGNEIAVFGQGPMIPLGRDAR